MSLIAGRLGVRYRQVMHWFQNRRSKERKKLKEGESPPSLPPSLPPSPPSLPPSLPPFCRFLDFIYVKGMSYGYILNCIVVTFFFCVCVCDLKVVIHIANYFSVFHY